jgi:hypothetical protein
MADEAITAAPVVTAPVEAAPAVAPVVESAPVAPVVESAPVQEAAPVVEAAPVAEPAVEAAKPLLSPEAEVKTEDAPVVEAPKPEAEVAQLPVYEFKLPEGADAENPQFKAFTSKLGEFQNLSKTEQAAVQKFGQEMIDMHMAEVKSIVENQNKSAWEWFRNRNKEWLENSKKDPSIGGDAFNETVSAASQAISLYGGNKAQQIETAKLLQETGVENHPALLRFLSNITRQAAKEGTPVASRNVPIQKQGIANAMYGGTSKS